MPTIEVFLMFPPGDRNGRGRNENGQRTNLEDPGWNLIGQQLRRNGYTLIVHGPSDQPSVQEIRDSMHNAEVTLLVGHGASINAVPGKFVSSAINLRDGMIRSPDGVLLGTWNATNHNLSNASAAGKLTINKVTGIFTCNSTDKMPDAFDLPPGSHLITNDGGQDGLTRIGTLEQGAADFVTGYGATKGNVRRAMHMAQLAFTQRGNDWPGDQGDRLSDKVGVTPPPPPMCEVKDW
jgi:hypothetical protein